MIATKVLGLMALAIAEWVMLTWTLMLLAGVIHNDVIPTLPAFGVRTSVALSGLIIVIWLASHTVSAAVSLITEDNR